MWNVNGQFENVSSVLYLQLLLYTYTMKSGDRGHLDCIDDIFFIDKFRTFLGLVLDFVDINIEIDLEYVEIDIEIDLEYVEIDIEIDLEYVEIGVD